MGEMLHAEKKPDLSAFSNSELKTLIEVKERFQDFGAKAAKDFSTGRRDTRKHGMASLFPTPTRTTSGFKNRASKRTTTSDPHLPLIFSNLIQIRLDFSFRQSLYTRRFI